MRCGSSVMSMCVRTSAPNAQYLGLPAEELIALYRCEHGTGEPIHLVFVAATQQMYGGLILRFIVLFVVVLVLVCVSYLLLRATIGDGESRRPTVLSLALAAATPLPLSTMLPGSIGAFTHVDAVPGAVGLIVRCRLWSCSRRPEGAHPALEQA